MGANWTETLQRRRLGAAAGFGVPRDLEALERDEIVELAEQRGIDTAKVSKKDLVAAVQGR